MKILVWGINYAPEVTGIAPCNTALCEYLQRKGHEVEMLTSFAYYPQWKKRPEDMGKLSRTDRVNQVCVHRCWHYVPAKVSALRRILHEGSFVATSFLRGLFLTRPDVCVVMSPPLLLGAAAFLLTRLKGTRYHFHVQDLQPDAAVGLNMLKPGLFTKLLYRLESFSYQHASKVSGIGPGMINAFRSKGVPPEKLALLPNGINLAEADQPSTGEFRKQYGFDANDFLAVYSGNLGVKQGLDILLDAAKFVNNPHFRLIVCGDGARRDHLASRVAAERLTNVRLLPLLGDDDYREMLRTVDVCLITQQAGSGNAFLPSKLLPTLAYRRAVISVADRGSALAEAVEQGQFGLNVEPDSAEALAAVLAKMMADREIVRQFSEAGRRYVERFDTAKVLADFEHALLEQCGF